MHGRLRLPGDAFDQVRQAMECPTPRVALGLALRGVASAAIDVSDGLLGDLGHVLRASGVGAALDLAAFPRSAILAAQSDDWQRTCLLTGGDDYELLFTAPAERHEEVLLLAASSCTPVHCVGRVVAPERGLVVTQHGTPVDLAGLSAFDHFKS